MVISTDKEEKIAYRCGVKYDKGNILKIKHQEYRPGVWYFKCCWVIKYSWILLGPSISPSWLTIFALMSMHHFLNLNNIIIKKKDYIASHNCRPLDLTSPWNCQIMFNSCHKSKYRFDIWITMCVKTILYLKIWIPPIILAQITHNFQKFIEQTESSSLCVWMETFLFEYDPRFVCTYIPDTKM